MCPECQEPERLHICFVTESNIEAEGILPTSSLPS